MSTADTSPDYTLTVATWCSNHSNSICIFKTVEHLNKETWSTLWLGRFLIVVSSSQPYLPVQSNVNQGGSKLLCGSGQSDAEVYTDRQMIQQSPQSWLQSPVWAPFLSLQSYTQTSWVLFIVHHPELQERKLLTFLLKTLQCPHSIERKFRLPMSLQNLLHLSPGLLQPTSHVTPCSFTMPSRALQQELGDLLHIHMVEQSPISEVFVQKISGTREMVRLIKCLPHKPEDLSSNPAPFKS